MRPLHPGVRLGRGGRAVRSRGGSRRPPVAFQCGADAAGGGGRRRAATARDAAVGSDPAGRFRSPDRGAADQRARRDRERAARLPGGLPDAKVSGSGGRLLRVGTAGPYAPALAVPKGGRRALRARRPLRALARPARVLRHPGDRRRSRGDRRLHHPDHRGEPPGASDPRPDAGDPAAGSVRPLARRRSGPTRGVVAGGDDRPPGPHSGEQPEERRSALRRTAAGRSPLGAGPVRLVGADRPPLRATGRRDAGAACGLPGAPRGDSGGAGIALR